MKKTHNIKQTKAVAKQKTAAEERELQIKQHKKDMLEALRLSLGIVSTAAEKVKITRKTHYDWYKNDPDYAEAVDDINEASIDFAESKLRELIDGVHSERSIDGEQIIVYKKPPDTGAVCFYLKCKGKKRGYIERQELTGAGGKDLIPANYDISKLTDAELLTLKTLQGKMEIKEMANA